MLKQIPTAMYDKPATYKCSKGSRFGHDTLFDAMLKDGLWDVYNDCAMGMCAELRANNDALTREEQVSHCLLL
jgi:acetyl-CoA acetyltransferase